MSRTMSSNIMGALGLLGAIDAEFKREVRGGLSGQSEGKKNRPGAWPPGRFQRALQGRENGVFRV